MKLIVRVLGLLALFLVVPLAASAQNAQWQVLGERVVNWRVDRDVIPVTAREGRFRSIVLEVQGNAIDMLDLQVQFGNGQTVDVPVRQNIPAGGRTRVIDLPGQARVIRAVQLVYRTDGRGRRGRAVVKVYGR